jgi:hypothetical protein
MKKTLQSELDKFLDYPKLRMGKNTVRVIDSNNLILKGRVQIDLITCDDPEQEVTPGQLIRYNQQCHNSGCFRVV